MFNPMSLTEHQARQFIERLRWPKGAVCPRCKQQEVVSVEGGRNGLYNCRQCRRQFTVTVGTIFEGSHIPLSKWVQAFHLVCSSKKGMSALQLSRMLGITYKSAWHMAHRSGIMGSYHHVSRKHLSRYCDEFTFRWSHRNIPDQARTATA